MSGLSGFSLKVAEKCLLGQGEHMGNVTIMQNNKSINDDNCILLLIIIFILLSSVQFPNQHPPQTVSILDCRILLSNAIWATQVPGLMLNICVEKKGIVDAIF